MDIIVCATQRCGSTLFIEDMRNASVLGMPEEWFIPWNPARSDVDWKSEFEKVVSQSAGGNGISSVKVMASQLDDIDRCFSTFVQPSDSKTFQYVAGAFKSAVWVWLSRDDVISQAISRLIAQQTSVYHATGNAKDTHFAGNLKRGYDLNYNAASKYNFRTILQQACAIVLENLAWKRFFEVNSIKPLHFVYESVIADDSMTHLDAVADAIGYRGELLKMPRKMVKLGNAKNEDWRDRFFQDAAAHRFNLKNLL